jgi:hypothetical protein
VEHDQTTQQAELLVRILVIERQLLEFEKSRDKILIGQEEYNAKLEAMKDNIRQYKNIPDIVSKIEKMESRLNTIDLEMVSMAPIKKVVSYASMFIIATMLTAFWGVITNNQSKTDYSEIAKKIISEYNKGEEKNNNGK